MCDPVKDDIIAEKQSQECTVYIWTGLNDEMNAKSLKLLVIKKILGRHFCCMNPKVARQFRGQSDHQLSAQNSKFFST